MRLERDFRKILVITLVLTFSISFVFAAVITDDIHLNIQTTNATGTIETGTFDFVFNISTTSDCAVVNVIYTNSTTLTTDTRGIISYYLPAVTLDYDEQYYLCYYRDGVLKDSSKIARTPYSFRAQNITLSGVEIDQDLDMGAYNITTTGTGFFGFLGSLASRITKLFVIDIDFNGSIVGTGNITTTGNVTADYLFGKGIYLTEVNDTFAQLSCGNEQVVKWNSTSGLWYCSDVSAAGAGDIDAVNTAGLYLTGGQTSGTVNLLLNETVLNATIDSRSIASELDPFWTGNMSDVAFTNIYETFDENVSFAKNVTFAGSILSGSGATSGGILNEATSSTNPTLVPSKGETGYGLGYGSSSLHLIANEVNVMEITDSLVNVTKNMTVQEYLTGAGVGSYGLVNVQSTSSVPSILPNKGETGYGLGYGSSSVHLIAGDTNVLEVTSSEAKFWKPANFTENVSFGGISGDILSGNLASSAALLNEQTSSINPTLIPNKAALGYGIGYGSQSLHLIADETNVVEIYSSLVNVTKNVTIHGNVTADYFFGDGSGLSGVITSETDPYWSANYSAYNDSWTSTDAEIWNVIANDTYVPYTSSNANVVLGDYNFSVGSTDLFVDASTGNVGIGTGSPDEEFHIRKDQNLGTTLKVQNNNTGPFAHSVVQVNINSASGSLWVADDGWTYGGWDIADKVVLNAGTTSPALMLAAQATAGEIQFYTGGYLAANRRMTIDSSGNVGINTSTPQQALNVVGDGNFTGNLYSNGEQVLTFYTETDPKWSANYTAYNDSWTTTYNATYNTWAYNQTIPATTYADATFITLANEGNLNVNSSDYWDGLNTPADILGSLINNDLNWINQSSIVESDPLWSANQTNYYNKTYVYNITEVDDFSLSHWTDDLGDRGYTHLTNFTDDILWTTGFNATGDSRWLGVGGESDPKWTANYTAYNESWSSTYNATYQTAYEYTINDTFVPYTGAVSNVDLGNNSFIVNESTLYVDSSTGRVGIGTSSPSTLLHLKGDAIYLSSANGEARGQLTMGSAGSVSSSLLLKDKNSATKVMIHTDGVSYFTGGNIGINTTTPQNTLNVVGTLNITNATGTLGLYQDAKGQVGIGTGSPNSLLHIEHYTVDHSNLSNSNNYPLRIRNTRWAAGQITGIEFWNGLSKTVPTSRIISQMAGSGNAGENLLFQTQPYSDTNPNPLQPTTKMIIKNTGNIGINTTTPQNTLNVVGDGNFTGNLYSNGVQVLTSYSETDPKWTANYSAYNDSWSKDTTYSHLTNFTDDLGDRGYTHLTNFTDDILWTTGFNATGDIRWLGIGDESDPKWSANYSAYNDSWTTTNSEIWAVVDNDTFVPYTGSNANVVLGDYDFTVNGTTFHVDASSGKVGVGTDSPGGKLDVVGGDLGTNLNSYSKPSWVQDGSIIANAKGLSGSKGSFVGAVVENVPAAFGGHFVTWNDSSNPDWLIGLSKGISGGGKTDSLYYFADSAAATNRLTIEKLGNIGIGINAPTSKLDVRGNVSLNNTLYVKEAGKVGIGTTTPQNTLNVVGDGNFTGTIYQNEFAVLDTRYSHLTNFTDDLSDRGYTHLTNFTDDILWTTGFNATGDTRWLGVGDESDPLWSANYSAYNDSWTTTNSEIWNVVDNNTFVPYTGAVSNVDLGSKNITASYFIGNGSQLTDVPAETLDGYDSSFFMPLNNSVYGQFDFNGDWQSGGVSIIDGDIYAQTGYFYNITGLDVNTLKINGSLLPAETFDNQFDIGNESLRWRDLYLGRNAVINGSLDVNEGNLYVDSSSGYVGINTTTPQNTFNVVGDINATGTIYQNEFAVLDARYSHLTNFTDDILWTTGFNATGDIRWLGIGDESDPKWSANYSAYNDSWTTTNSEIWAVVDNDTFAPISEPKWTANYTAYNDSWTTTDAEIQAAEIDPFWSSNYTAYNDSWSSTYNATYQTAYEYTANDTFVPYTSAVSNVVLGDNNFSVGTSDLFVDASSGKVGIGTSSPSTLLQIANDGWISAKNNAGTGTVNMFKVNVDDQIEVGGTLNIGSFEFDEDSGLVTFVDMPVSSTPSAGTSESYVFKVDGDNIMTVYAEADGSGGVQNKRVGIGTITPKNTLNVVGDANITGTLYVNEQEVLTSYTETDPLWSANQTNYYNKTYVYNTTEVDDFSLSHWTDDLGNRGYTHLTNFTDNLGNRGYTHLTNFTDDILWTTGFNATGDTRWLGVGGETDPKWSANYTAYNDSWTTTYNATYNTWAYNQTTPARTYSDNTFITLANEGNLNVNRSDYWDNYNTASDLNDLITIQGENITGGTIDFARLPSLDYKVLSKWANITDAPTTLSFFSDDLGDRGYTHLTNFTDNLGNRGYTHLTNFTDDILWTTGFNATGDSRWLGVGGETDPKWTANYTAYNDSWTTTYNATYNTWAYNQTIPATTYADATFITLANEGNLNVNSSDYWDGLNTPADINTADLTDDNTYVQVVGDTMTGDLIMQSNLTLNTTPGNWAANPTLSFGDGDTGFYEYEDDAIFVVSNGGVVGTFRASGISGGSWATGKGLLTTAAATSTTPAITFGGDTDTGMGRATADQLSLIAGGNETARLTYDGNVKQLIVNPGYVQNNVSKPSLAFGDGDTGFYESVDDVLHVKVGGGAVWTFGGGNVYAQGKSNGPMVQWEDASAINPVFATVSDADTGVGRAAADQLSLIAGGAEIMRLSNTSGTLHTQVNGTLNATGEICANGICLGDTVTSETDPKWTANYSAYNDSWTTTNSEIWNVVDNDTFVPYTGSNANVVLGDYNFSVGSTDLFVDASSGKVGIGTGSPSNLLEVGSAGNFYVNTNGDLKARHVHFGLTSDTPNGAMGNLVVRGSSATNNPLRIIGYNGAERFIVRSDDGSGNVGIGTSTPQNTLNVIGDANVTGNLISDTIHQTSSQGLVLSMSFNNNSVDGLNVLDASGHNNHGTATDSNVSNDDGNTPPIHDSTGGFNGGGVYEFDGVDDYVEIPSPSIGYLTSTMTVSVWFNSAETLTSASGRHDIVSKYFGPYIIYNAYNGNLTYVVYNSENIPLKASKTMDITANIWYHVVGTHNATHANLYINNVFEDTASGDMSSPRLQPSDTGIGSHYDGTNYFFNGSIDNVQIYDRALSSDEVVALYYQRAESLESFVSQKHVYVDSSGNVNLTTGSLSMFNKQIHDLANATSAQDAVALSQLQAVNTSLVGDYVPYTGATQNVDLGSKNITASWFKGIFNWIIGATSTNYLSFNGTQLNFDESALNATIDNRAVTSESDPYWSSNYTAYNDSWTSTDAEIWNVIANDTYVPYTGAVSNVDLGANNFSVDTNVLFVDSNSNRVGINTTTPQQELNVVGDVNVTETIYIGGAEVFTDDSSGDMIFRI